MAAPDRDSVTVTCDVCGDDVVVETAGHVLKALCLLCGQRRPISGRFVRLPPADDWVDPDDLPPFEEEDLLLPPFED